MQPGLCPAEFHLQEKKRKKVTPCSPEFLAHWRWIDRVGITSIQSCGALPLGRATPMYTSHTRIRAAESISQAVITMVWGPAAYTASLPPPWQDRHDMPYWRSLLQWGKEKRKPLSSLELLCAWISAERMQFTEPWDRRSLVSTVWCLEAGWYRFIKRCKFWLKFCLELGQV